MVQGKTTKLNYKSKKIIYLPEEDWIVVENMHEPIIKESDFKSVQLLIKSNKNTTTNTHDYLLKANEIKQRLFKTVDEKLNF